jgi:hypothetical protein
LNKRQLRKVKFASGAAVLFLVMQLGTAYFLGEAEAQINWDGQDWKAQDEVMYDRGRIHYYSTNS